MAQSRKPERVARTPRKSELLPGVSNRGLLAAYAAAQPWLRRSYVTGIGIGYARKAGELTGELALSVHVAKRIPDHALTERQRFPRRLLGVRVDVVEVNLCAHLSQEEVRGRRQAPATPLCPGVQFKTSAGIPGTVGLLVKARSSPQTFILGAGHVMTQAGTTVFQPNASEARRLTGTVTRVERSLGDCGIAAYTGRLAENRPYGSGLSIQAARAVRLNDELQMSGAYSGITVGIVEWIGQKTMWYDNGQAIDVPGFLLRPKSAGERLTQPGDSGALWFDMAGAAVGINVGGEAGTAPWAFACHLVQMMDVLDVTL